jgi:hypothetical protein
MLLTKKFWRLHGKLHKWSCVKQSVFSIVTTVDYKTNVDSTTSKLLDIACSLEFSAAYLQPVSSVFLSHKSANSIFNRLFSAQANKLDNACSVLFITNFMLNCSFR